MRRGFPRLVVAAVVLSAGCAPAMTTRTSDLGRVQQDQVLHGFRATAVYTAGAEKVIGARFQDDRTGLGVHLLRFQSVPQAYLWVNTFPDSDQGEPHTQEHLLLGKGNRGRYVASLEEMSLVGSSAYTTPLRTCYHFNTTAGAEVFWRVFEARLDALLHPDYTDEEIRREVRHFGTDTGEDGALRLEEKGTVYQEMVSTYDKADAQLWLSLDRTLFGKGHPLSYSAGGTPEGIRAMTVEDIRVFHREHYHLGNMGVILALPDDVPLEAALERLQAMLTRLEKTRPQGAVVLDPDALPTPKTSREEGTITMVPYPHENTKRASSVILSWPAVQGTTVVDSLLMDLLLANTVGDETSTLYKQFIDSNTRTLDTGATAVWGGTRMYGGRPLYIGLSDVPVERLGGEQLEQVRNAVTAEYRRISDWEDGSADVMAFNERALDHVTATRRSLAKFVNSPPGFGARGTPTSWMDHFQELSRTPGFEKSVTLTAELAEIEKRLRANENVWRTPIQKWRLLDTQPWITATRGTPELRGQIENAAQARRDAHIATLQKTYGVKDEAEALKRFAAEQAKATAVIEAAARQVDMPKFIDDPPLTQDDRLDYSVDALPANIPLVVSRFDAMRSGTVGLALRVDGLAEDQLLYLSVLTDLISGSGIHGNGETIPYAEMKDRLRREVLSVTAYGSSNMDTGRAEIIFWGQGNDLKETRTAIAWIERLLAHPDWRPENLGRIRDLVDQRAKSLRNTMQGSEESWVQGPAAAYRFQRDPVLLRMGSFLTQAHDVHRMRWLLRSAGDDAESSATWLRGLAKRGESGQRQKLEQHLETLGKDEKLPELRQEIAADLVQHLADIPDANLAADWAYLCRQIELDLAVDPADVLRELNATRERLLRSSNARAFVVGSPDLADGVRPDLERLVGHLKVMKVERLSREGAAVVDDALRDRDPGLKKPEFVGLVNPNTASGVFLYSAAGPRLEQLDRDSLLDYLSARLYSGGGAHSLFMKTWGAGLAYSNGIGASAVNGRVNYYAERCPKLSQTMSFVTGELEKATPDDRLTEYAIAQVFSSRAASSYESRGAAMAGDLADGLGPEKISRYRKALLQIRDEADLTGELFGRMPGVYGRVLPGYGPRLTGTAGGNFFVVAAEGELAAFERWLQGLEGEKARVHRLYPRDFWVRRALDKS